MNEAFIIGNLARDPELKWINKETCVVKFQLATNERWLDKDGNKMEKTDWHNCSAWGKKAETISKFVKKGDRIAIRGKIRNNNFETKEGTKVYGYEIVVENFEFCGGKKSNGDSNDNSQNDQASEPPHEEEPKKTTRQSGKKSNLNGSEQDDDIPF